MVKQGINYVINSSSKKKSYEICLESGKTKSNIGLVNYITINTSVLNDEFLTHILNIIDFLEKRDYSFYIELNDDDKTFYMFDVYVNYTNEEMEKIYCGLQRIICTRNIVEV